MDTSIYVGGGSAGGGGGGSGYNLISGGVGMLGAAPHMIGSAVAQAQPQWFGEEVIRSQKRTNILIEQVENGYYVSINNKRFVCVDPQEISERIISEMVAAKMEK